MSKEKKSVDEINKIEEEENIEPRKTFYDFLLDNSGKINVISPIIAGFKIWILQTENKKRMFGILYTDKEWNSLINKYKNEPISEGRKE